MWAESSLGSDDFDTPGLDYAKMMVSYSCELFGLSLRLLEIPITSELRDQLFHKIPTIIGNIQIR